MSHKLINLNSDLKRLRDEGYEIEIKSAHLLVHSIPYVNSKKEIAFGILVTPLGDLAGDKTTKPKDHVIHFVGEHPCDKNGVILKGIINSSENKTLADEIVINHSFSNKPAGGFPDYYEKVVSYVRIIVSQAKYFDPTLTAKTYKVIETSTDLDTAFNYLDTNSSRSEINLISEKLKDLKIAIIGLGGTGSYVLDFVSKTQVKEIHLFDEDYFLSHNAFRTPGAASIKALKKKPRKVVYLHRIYSKMHKHVIAHEEYITRDKINYLSDMNFVFICLDNGEDKAIIIKNLVELSIPFIDVGIGILTQKGSLIGCTRVTTVAHKKSDHISRRISFTDNEDDDYTKNIQIAEINALNAALAVIKWKKIFGFYHDQMKELNSIYDIGGNIICNDEIIT